MMCTMHTTEEMLTVLKNAVEFANRGHPTIRLFDSRFLNRDNAENHDHASPETLYSDHLDLGTDLWVPHLILFTGDIGNMRIWLQKPAHVSPRQVDSDMTLTSLFNDENKARAKLEGLEQQSELDTTVVGPINTGRDEDSPFEDSIEEYGQQIYDILDQKIRYGLPKEGKEVIEYSNTYSYVYFNATDKLGPVRRYTSTRCAAFLARMNKQPELMDPNDTPFRPVRVSEVIDDLNHCRFKPGSAVVLAGFISTFGMPLEIKAVETMRQIDLYKTCVYGASRDIYHVEEDGETLDPGQ